MVERFKFGLSKVMESFRSCRSKDPTNLPENPLPSAFFMLSPVNPKAIDIDFPSKPPSKSRHSSSHVANGCRSKPPMHCDCDYVYVASDDNTESTEFRWKKEEKWHVVARVQGDNINETPRPKIYSLSVSGESEVDLSSTPTVKVKKQRNKKKKSKQTTRLSTSSTDGGWFSSEGGDANDDEETETLVSTSRTFSNDSSSEFNAHLATIHEPHVNGLRRKKKEKKNLKRVTKRVKLYNSKVNRRASTSPESESPARLSVFQRLMSCKVEGKVKESFAVVKKSKDPFEDFKRSMLEMIMEKQIFDARELEQLLYCFLSLNSRHYHAVIVDAFSEIWQIMFCKSPLNQFA